MDQIIDKKTIGIPSDIEYIRHETEQFMNRTRDYSDEAANYAKDASDSAYRAAVSETNAWTAASEASYWATLHNQGIHFGPAEPQDKWDGMTWLQTNESTRTITAFKRWDFHLSGNGVFPSNTLYPSDELYPNDQGDWTPFSIASSLVK